MRKRCGSLVAVTVLALAAAMHAAPQNEKKAATTAQKVSIRDPWIAEGPPTARATGGFFVAENSGEKEAAIVEVKSELFRSIELHEVVNENNSMAMRKMERFRIPARGKLTLQPGGYHLMMFGVARPLHAGDKVSLTLRFDDGSEARVEAEVRKRQERGM